MCQGRSTPYVGDGHLIFKRNRYNGYINPYYWVDEFIPYYMEISWELIDPIAHMTAVKIHIAVAVDIHLPIFHLSIHRVTLQKLLPFLAV